VQYTNILAMIFNEIKCHVNTSFGLVGGCIPLHGQLKLMTTGSFRWPCKIN